MYKHSDIFGIAAPPATDLLYIQTSPSSRHNTPSSGSPHLFAPLSLNGPLWIVLETQAHLCPVPRPEESICISVFDVWMFPLGLMLFEEEKQQFMQAPALAPLLFCLLCNSDCQLGKTHQSQIFQSTICQALEKQKYV